MTMDATRLTYTLLIDGPTQRLKWDGQYARCR